MAKNFQELRAGMSPAAKAASDAEHRRLIEEMSLLQLRKARDAGKGILLVSADLPEVIALSDRIAVMYGGRFATVMRAADASPERLGPFMTGAAT